VKNPHYSIQRVAVKKILPLRHRILRAGLPSETANFDGDNAVSTLHVAALAGDVLGASPVVAGCLSFMLNTYNGEPAWQLRGMAVDEPHQGRGLGRKLLTWGEAAVAAEGKAIWFWCNARTPAAAFYQKQGWKVVSEVFEIPTAGPHVKMCKKINGAKPLETIEKRASPR
jgi:GNAT superfamily N-acetyltransferase